MGISLSYPFSHFGQDGVVTWSPVLNPVSDVKKRTAIFHSHEDPQAVCGQTAFFRYPNMLVKLNEWGRARLTKTGSARHLFAACSTGPEPYSYAMLVRASGQLHHGDVRIDAVDIRPEFLSYARRAIYPGFMTANLPPSVQRHFHGAHDGCVRLRRTFRRMVNFTAADLTAAPLTRSYDSIVMCNLLQWLTDKKAVAALDNTLPCLKPGGVLVLDSRSAMKSPDLLRATLGRHGMTGVHEDWSPVIRPRQAKALRRHGFAMADLMMWPEYNDLFIAARPAV